MKAIISGQAGLTAFIQGNEIAVVSIDNLQVEKRLPLNTLGSLLADATDINVFEDISKQRALTLLEEHWRFDRSLHLMIVLLDINKSEKVSLLAAECLEDFFNDKEIFNKVTNIMYSAPLPSTGSIEKALKISSGKTILMSFLKEIERDQPTIKKYSEAWHAVPTDYFESLDKKDEFKYELIKKGAFRYFVKADNNSAQFGMEQVKLLTEFKTTRNYRQILTKWLNNLKPKQIDASSTFAIIEYPLDKKEKEFILHRPKQRISEILENIEKQKKGIIEKLKEENMGQARRYVEQLINMQKENSEPEHIAKTLCDLAQEAKDIYNYSFQLELTQRAVAIAPLDGWSHGQLADAYFCLHKFDEALTSFDAAIANGEEAFGLSGRAKILCEQGRLEEAFDSLDDLKNRFLDKSSIWAERAEVLRRMWWLDLAVAAYDEAINKFPTERILKCGRAATLEDMGQLDKAIAAYEECANTLGDDPVSINGLATVFRKMGNYKKALSLYDNGIKRFSNDVGLKYGYAKTIREMGEFNNAVREFNNICEKYPYEVRAWIGKAEVLKELRLFEEAIKVYDQASEKFPFNNWVRNGRASVYKKQGAYEKALQAYEDNLSHAPYDIIAKCGKADLLKELGEFEEALKTYDDIIIKNTNKKSLQHAKASIFITLGLYAEAEKLLFSDRYPQTIDDWIAYHVKAVLLMKKNEMKLAIESFNYGMEKCPFIKIKKYFHNSLAIAKLREKDFKSAIQCLPKGSDPITNILTLHGWGEITKKDKRKITKIQITKIARNNLKANCPPYLIPLMVELELRYFDDDQKGKHSDEWVFEQECNSGALSLVAE